MSRPLEAIIADFDALTPSDFESECVGMEKLYRLCDEVQVVGDAVRFAPVMFRVMERLEGVELGTPGPLVHVLEAWHGYERFLADSLNRKPSPLGVWMVNRILNANPMDRDHWLAVLNRVLDHPSASESTRSAARLFLDFQAQR